MDDRPDETEQARRLERKLTVSILDGFADSGTRAREALDRCIAEGRTERHFSAIKRNEGMLHLREMFDLNRTMAMAEERDARNAKRIARIDQRFPGIAKDMAKRFPQATRPGVDSQGKRG